MIVIDVIIIVFLFALFAFSHTWLATLKIKKNFAGKMGNKIAFYRLFYNLTSVLFFAFFYFVSPKPDVIVYDLHYPFDIITFALQFLSFIGLIWAAKQTDLKEFIGISQVKRYLNGSYIINELDEKQILRKDGAFKLVRHPIYLFSILFLGFRPTMDLFYFVMFICIVVYFYVGSIYEERKLIEIFGEDYRRYQQKVPRIIPFIKMNSN
ncbi:MAG: isoprenylcysteine carboxylmethyltransferase family protein [Ignavibacteria bacterium]|nr:isoprenylcysteine carboxylmethyltransferase family protein [Ignavibacteria bacterium]